VFEMQSVARVPCGEKETFVKPRKVIRALGGTGRVEMIMASKIIGTISAEMNRPGLIPRMPTASLCEKTGQ